MEKQSKICQNCKKRFTIEPDDFVFYEKIKVPPPTFCPECRMQRRFAWRNERTLHRRKCGLTGKDVITCFSPNSGVTVYDRDEWWSDKWDPLEYGITYDFKVPFFEQFKKLLNTVPMPTAPRIAITQTILANSRTDTWRLRDGKAKISPMHRDATAPRTVWMCLRSATVKCVTTTCVR